MLSIAAKYADAVRRILTVRGIYLYGSYARGTAGKDSDIDIAVVVDEMPEDYLGTLALLWKLTRGEGIDIVLFFLKVMMTEVDFLKQVFLSDMYDDEKIA